MTKWKKGDFLGTTIKVNDICKKRRESRFLLTLVFCSKAVRPASYLRASIASEPIPQRNGVPTSNLLQADQPFSVLAHRIVECVASVGTRLRIHLS